MDHFLVLVILPKEIKCEDAGIAIAEQLYPFDSTCEYQPQKVYLDAEEIFCMSKFFGIAISDLNRLSEKTIIWNGKFGGVDENGLYVLDPYNHNAKYSHAIVGGRWNGMLNPSVEDTLLKNINLLKRVEPYIISQVFNILTPNYCWYQFNFSKDPLKDRILEEFADHPCVAVDCTK